MAVDSTGATTAAAGGQAGTQANAKGKMNRPAQKPSKPQKVADYSAEEFKADSFQHLGCVRRYCIASVKLAVDFSLCALIFVFVASVIACAVLALLLLLICKGSTGFLTANDCVW